MKRFLILFLLIGLGSLSAQSFVKHFNVYQNDIRLRHSSDTLKILAVMVDFQPDKYDGTIGTGKFGSHYTQTYGDTILDPLPHDADYFSDHLEFARNYFRKVSDGKVNISYKVLPNVVTVSKYIRDYVPDYKSQDLTKLGNFSQEVWKLADQMHPDFSFSDYELFVIFHAGVSSGLDVGSFSIDRNMPSLYLSTKTLKEIFGNQFIGFPVNKNSSLINNSIILPETESREFTAVDDSKYLLEITINGALVSNIASHLGLPDLFNTETGTSAIGRFGLMDGQAIIANFGMFPPEPSPWEKMFLGWEVPKSISIGNNHVNVTNRLTAALSDTTLLKIPINSNEYFLVENRSQDANKDKVKITYRRAGKSYIKTVEPDTSGLFNVSYTSIEGGVVIDVDEFDAAVPGNGIVIWHIDENIINQKITENKINSDLNMKGVDVEEADGIQDIGELFSSFLGTSIGEGSFEDFWYKGNKAKLYKNRFSFDTKPNTKSNNGANSLITLKNFSDKSNKMSFDVKFGHDAAKIVSFTKLNVSKLNILFTARNYSFTPYIYIIENSTLHKVDLNGKIIKSIPNFSQIQPIVFDFNAAEYVIGAYGSVINIYSINAAEEKLKVVITTANQITALAYNPNIASKPNILFGLWLPNGRAYSVPFENLLLIDQFDLNSFVLFDSNYKIKNFGIGDNYYSILTEKEVVKHSTTPPNVKKTTTFNLKAKKLILTKDKSGKNISVVLHNDNYFSVVSDSAVLHSFYVNSSSEINTFAIADIFHDGSNYILIANGTKVEAYNFQGVLADNFPIFSPDKQNILETILVLDFNNDKATDLICFIENGKIFIVEPKSGKINGNLTLSTGSKLNVPPIIISEELPTMGPQPSYKPYLAVLDESNSLTVWSLSNVQGMNYWVNSYGNSHNSSFVKAAEQSSAESEYFPLNKAYNWPNPVYGNQTNIRYYVSENSEAVIKIFDLSGKMVAELQSRAIGGLDNETVWDVTNVQSGVYYARIELKSVSGKSADKLIKIAVIK